MSILGNLLVANQQFAQCEYQKKMTGVLIADNLVPVKRLAVVACMDARLTGFLEPALGLKRGDAIVIKNAGNAVTGTIDNIINSLLVSIFEMGVREIVVVGHADCVMSQTTSQQLAAKMLSRGIEPLAVKTALDEIEDWVDSFTDPYNNVRKVVTSISQNPLIPKDIPVHGLFISLVTGITQVLVNGYIPVDAAG